MLLYQTIASYCTLRRLFQLIFFFQSLGTLGVRMSTLHLVKGVSAVGVISQQHLRPHAKQLLHERGL